jgi:hypothetical protein
MADSDKPDPPKTADDIIADLDRKVAETRVAFTQALSEHFTALTNAANFKGWNEGFSKGWDAAAKYFKETMGQQLEEARAAQSRMMPDRLQDIPTMQPSEKQNAPTALTLVLEYIKANPGLRGVQIAQHFDKALFQLPERTVRTALHRLRNRQIKIVDGRWYTLAAAPADPQPSLMRDDDAAP